jgi:hypothetical protein
MNGLKRRILKRFLKYKRRGIKKNRQHNAERDLALKLQAEILVLKSLVLKTSVLVMAQNQNLLKTLKKSCLEELSNLKIVGIEGEDQKKFLNFAETTIEDMFSRVQLPDDNKVETFH